jgi:hypothetical protein
MAYIGRGTDKISNIEVLDNITFDGSSSYSITKNSVAFTPSSANTLLISIDGVVQATNFTVSSSLIDFGVAVASTSTCDFFLHYGTGLITTPADGTVTTAKLANSSVSLDKLSATGTKDATTFLRGDNTFQTVSSYADSDALTLFNASGSAPVYACRAWVNFNGTSTVSIRDSGNISSITDNGVGDYTINFTTNLEDSNYSVVAMGGRSATSILIGIEVHYNLTTSNFRLETVNTAGNGRDYEQPTLAVFR